MRPLPPVTDWFPADVKPARPGVYEVEPVHGRLPCTAFFADWDGLLWSVSGWELPPVRWRGLSADPSVWALRQHLEAEVEAVALAPLPPAPTHFSGFGPAVAINLQPGAIGARLYRGHLEPVRAQPAHRAGLLPPGWPFVAGLLLCLAYLVWGLLAWN